MKKTIFLSLAVSLANHTVAAIPHTFSPGTPAKAAEVNANFASLDQRIKNLEVPITPENNISYNSIPSSLGHVINIDGVDYTIQNQIFLVPQEKSTFKIKLPSRGTPTATLSQLRLVKEIDFKGLRHDYTQGQVTSLTIDGLPALIHNRFFMESETGCSTSVYIDLGNNNYADILSMWKPVSKSFTVDSHDINLDAPIDYNCATPSSLDDLIDYIKVVDITP